MNIYVNTILVEYSLFPILEKTEFENDGILNRLLIKTKSNSPESD